MVSAGGKHVVCVGGGHCNAQVLKFLKNALSPSDTLTLVTEGPCAYYSGMLPGTVAKLYDTKQLQLELKPLAVWCKARYIEKLVTRVIASENRLEMEDGSVLTYDVLVLNIGSQTRGTSSIPGVLEHALTSRPITELLAKFARKEAELLKNAIVPEVVVVGAGAAGFELSVGLKARWCPLFGVDISVTLIASRDDVVPGLNDVCLRQLNRKLDEKGIKVVKNGYVVAITSEHVLLADRRKIKGNVFVWATGAEPRELCENSDLELLDGYFRVNDFMQSTSHSNVFAGGDCAGMESYAHQRFPPKAGVYAVFSAPVIGQNVVSYIQKKDLKVYKPQKEFLSLLMLGDETALGTKFGMSFAGRWVWQLKDYIDLGFMRLFKANYLFRDYETKGCSEPVENDALFDSTSVEEMLVPLRKKVELMVPETAACILGCPEHEEEFHERWLIIQRMNRDDLFARNVADLYNPPYYDIEVVKEATRSSSVTIPPKGRGCCSCSVL